jgi:enamine deaminase RidA (YjgF/YER057c/UK114 family)
MGVTSNDVKQRWNDGHYTQVKVSVPTEIAASFKAHCSAACVSMASEIARFMSAQSGASHSSKTSADPLATRQQRRRALNKVIALLEAIIDAEQSYADNFPANLQSSSPHDAAEQTVSALDEAVNILNEAY